MSNVKTNLIKVNAKKGNLTEAAYIALTNNLEGNMVYLDNAYGDVAEYMTPRQWAGCLANLTKQGRYEQDSGEFGGEWGYVI